MVDASSVKTSPAIAVGDAEELASVIYEALCARTDPGTSAWYRSIERPEFLVTARAVLTHLRAQRSPSDVNEGVNPKD